MINKRWILAGFLGFASIANAQELAASSADRQPGDIEFNDRWPGGALDVDEARVVVECELADRGYLRACQIVSSYPAGKGFDSIALSIVRDSKAVNGAAGSIVRLPIHFQKHRSVPKKLNGRFDRLAWRAAPSWSEFQQAFPAEAKTNSGDARIRCAVRSNAKLEACVVVSEKPYRQGFGQAAIALAPLFEAQLSPDEAAAIGKVQTELSFHFTRPGQPDGRRLAAPQWTRRISLDQAEALYPSKAKAASVTKGEVRLACVVTREGRLSACNLLNETPGELGFAEAARSAAEGMSLSVWTPEGFPAEGITVTVPVLFNGP